MPSAPVPAAIAIASLSLFGSAACDVTIRDGDVSIKDLRGRATREWSRQYPLSPGGRVELNNANGSIEVSARPGEAVSAAAVMTARAMRDDRANALLDDVKIEETATLEHIRVATVRGGRDRGVRVDYKLTVPPDARIELTANNGSVTVRGLAGHVKAMVVNGPVELTDLKGSIDAAAVNGPLVVKLTEVTDRIRLEGTNGHINLELPKDAKALLNARAVNGGITVTGLATQEASGRRIRNLESVLNGGGPEIQVRITNGGITIQGK